MKNIFIILLLLGSIIPCEAQSFQDLITAELTELAKNSHLVGFSTAIVNKDSIVYSKGFGFADKETKIPYTVYTAQPIASISKTLLAVALMKAQEMGKLHLNDNINDYLPFKIYNPNFPNENITIQQLANHTSSILDGVTYDRTYIFKNKIPPFYNDFADNELKAEVKTWVELFNENEMIPLGEFIKKQYVEDQIWYNKKQNFSSNHPGSTYKYSNMGANIAAYIIEQATGENYAEFVKEQILIPLQMNNTGWRGKNYEPKNTSTLYWYGYPMPDGDLITYPDGNLMSTIIDYGKFLSTMIRGYEGEGILLTTNSYKEMMKNPVSSDFRKGIFWTVDSEKIGHSGSDLGLLAHAYFLKENGIGIIVFVNTSDTENGMIEVRDIYRTLLKYAKKESTYISIIQKK
ncbi:MAG: serine hydrolase domain-containing protein [Flavobacteriaceae bacterium]